MLHLLQFSKNLILGFTGWYALHSYQTPASIDAKLAGTATKQWILVGQRETLGQACDSGQILTFRQAATPKDRKMQMRRCVQGMWQATTHSWATQVKGADAVLLLDGKPTYYVRFITQDGSPTLRLTERGSTPTASTKHYYFQSATP